MKSNFRCCYRGMALGRMGKLGASVLLLRLFLHVRCRLVMVDPITNTGRYLKLRLILCSNFHSSSLM